MRRRPPLPALVAVLALVPTGGCCSLARLFCGPDKTPWVSVDFTTPERTVRTLLEALRRDDPEVVYECLSHGFRSQKGIDSATAQIVWPKIRAEAPGLHVAGYADVPTSQRLGPDRARIDLDIEGRALVVELVRQRATQVRWQRAGQAPMEKGAVVTDFAPLLDLDDDEDGRLRVQITFEVKSSSDPAAILGDLAVAGLVAEWKVDRLAMATP
ncbi:MAG: hypothetical protein JNK15_14470 [Planctomycetes bacterium]|nr:hypothetical protein [Planctomycetota bacterium]